MFSTDSFLHQDPYQVDPTISLRTLLDVIKRHRSLQDARIVQIDSYRNSGSAQHRFIILQLEREGRQQIWLRVDQQRDKRQSLLIFAIRAGKSSANDRVSRHIDSCAWSSANSRQAWLSADKLVLSEGLDPEHTMSFSDATPTLGDLRWVFFAIVQVLEQYELLVVRVKTPTI